MKSHAHLTGFIWLSSVLALMLIGLKSYSQQEITRDSDSKCDFGFDKLEVPLKQTFQDTILPTIGNSGNGLFNIQCASLWQEDKDYNCYIMGDRNMKAVRADYYTEEELKFLHERQRMMQEKCNYEVQKQIRKEKMDIGLGELLKGFYMKPMF